jgi:tetratricopeptide (TPR) repeat protein
MSDVVSEIPAATDERIPTARAAIERHAWREGFDLMAAVDGEDPTALSGDDLEALASAAFFTAQAELGLELKERAFRRDEADGNALRAGYLAIDIARTYGFAGKSSIASAWARRAERLVGRDGETYAHGYLALVGSEAAASAGELDRALELAERAIAIGSHAADPDLTAFAQVNLGALKIAAGDTTDGFALMEEASIAAVNGELTPFTGGVTACRMIGACRDLTDYRRANEWIEATEKY